MANRMGPWEDDKIALQLREEVNLENVDEVMLQYVYVLLLQSAADSVFLQMD